MEFHSFLIKYSEIAVKGKNRFMFEDKLVARIERALKAVDGDFTVTKTSGRIYVDAKSAFDEKDVTQALQKVFGIVWICPLIKLKDEGFEVLKEKVIAYLKECYGERALTFKVLSRRTRKNYPLTSDEICPLMGEAILQAMPNLRVNVHDPDFFVNIEIRDEFINLYTILIPGPGGVPVGVGGKGMLLLSGGIDSPVAGYMIAKRGLELEAVYFHAPPYTSERAKKKVVDLAELVSRYSGPIRLHVVNFTEVQLYIYETCPHDELTIIMRRVMMRIAERIAKENGCNCLITGESIGQVASQTVQSLTVTNAAVEDLPVFRPVIGFDKQEIIEVAKRIETFETSILPYEDCCTIFVAKHPVTKPLLKVIEASETKLENIGPMVEKAVAEREILEVG